MSVSLLHDAPWSFCFYSLQKVSGQQILEVCFEWILSFALRLVVHIHAYGKSNLKVQKAWIPDCLSFINIYIYIFQRVFVSFLFLFTTFLFIYLFIQQNSNKAEIKLYERKGAF